MFAVILLPIAIALIIGVMWLVKGKDWKTKQREFPPKPEDHKPGDFG
jgi:hypothetical protein